MPAVGGRWAINIAPSTLYNPRDNKLWNNILWTDHASYGSISLPEAHPTGFESDYNVVRNGNRFSTDWDETRISFAAWQALGYDAHSIAVDTLAAIGFVNAAAADFHLQSTSPAIDAGKNLSAGDGYHSVTDDFSGTARPQGSAYDIGAFEFVPAQPTAVAPVFTPPAGAYAGSVDVSISSTTPGATVRYTTNGADPTPSSNAWSTPLHVVATTTFKARAYAAGYNPSSIVTAIYTIDDGATAAPTFAPPAGTYSGSQSVTINCATAGAEIRYTTNGTDPTQSSSLYSSPILVSTTLTLKARAYASGRDPSSISSAAYKIDSQSPLVSSLATIPTQVYQGVEPNVTLTGTATDAARGNSNITRAEYFIGGDPGAGSGVAMSAADGSFDSPTEGLLATVPTTGWAPPQMKINVRARDAAGNWSTAQEIFIPVRSSTPPGAIINLSVESETTYTLSPISAITVCGEYPSLGKGNLTDGSFDTYFQTAGTPVASQEEIKVDLAAQRRVGALAMVSSKITKLFPADLTIEVSQNDSDWTLVAEARGLKVAAKTRYLWEFEPQDARYIRVRGLGRGGTKTANWLWQVAEIEVPQSMATTGATLSWTAPADDGYAGSAAAEYVLRWSRLPITATNWNLATEIDIPAPAAPGAAESEVVDLGDMVGKAYFAIKTRDADGNTSSMSNVASTSVGGLRIEAVDPSEGEVLTATNIPVFYFNTGSAVKNVLVATSALRGFPMLTVYDGGSKVVTYRQTQKPGVSSWKISSAQWKKIKSLVGHDRLSLLEAGGEGEV